MRGSILRAAALQAVLLFSAVAAAAPGNLGDNQRISSAHLGYDLQYRVYRPSTAAPAGELPSLYVTDGQMYLAYGDFKSILDHAIETGRIEPVVVIFLDSRNPDDLDENRRNEEFMCSIDFARFFAQELIPAVSQAERVSSSREDRVILGVSFGGLNSACFGIMLPEFFAGIAMQSPASGEHLDVVRELYEKQDKLPLRVFMSAGTRNDNLAAVKRLKRVLERKGYDLTYMTVREGHDWQNWTPLLDDVLETFFAIADPSE